MSELRNAWWTEKVGRFYAAILHDDDAESPDSWDSNPGRMVTWGDRWAEGPGDRVSEPDRECREDAEGYWFEPDVLTWCDFIRAIDSDAVLMLPVRFEDYGLSGASIRVVDLDQAWDDATGAIYVTESELRTAWCVADGPISADAVLGMLDYLHNVVRTWNMYFHGEIYGAVVLDEDGDIVHEVAGTDVESLWGIYDEYPYSYAKSEALDFAQDAEDAVAEADAEDATHGAPMFVTT